MMMMVVEPRVMMMEVLVISWSSVMACFLSLCCLILFCFCVSSLVTWTCSCLFFLCFYSCVFSP